jgi:adenylate cyclase class 1
MTTFKNKLAPDFTDGVDRKLLKKVRDRFYQVNSDRMEKTRLGLSARHQDILRVIPLLYHINHPLMPGYVSQEAPVGVSLYEPDKITLSIAKSFSQTFRFKSQKRQQKGIHALYMMGSTGTLAHSESSDVDLWLCHASGLSSTQLESLSEKAKKIDIWADSLGLELHTFLMNAEHFKSGGVSNEMDKESSGSAQHYLLLDEFYRTAILLAGRYPVWWLIPPAFEHEYEALVEKLLSKRFIKAAEVLDFGSAGKIPKSELIGAGLWQLYKGLDSPYKSVLKILLAEVYAQELPEADTLSQTFKKAVYDDELSVEGLDPYFLIYRRLEGYLKRRRESKRLDIVQKSFYLKVAKKLSRRPSGRTASWQRKVLEQIVRNWGWPDDKFSYLDSRVDWKVDEVIQERQALVAELSYCYRFLSQYARAHQIQSSITAEDLNLLGRKLYATFQKKAGKIECVNPGIAHSLWEENLAIHHTSSQVLTPDQPGWLLYRNISTASDASFESTIKKTTNLIELLSWLYFNGIINSATRLSLISGDSELSLHEIRSMLRAFEQVFSLPLPYVAQSQYQTAAYIERITLFVNVGVDPMKDLSEKGMHRLSDRTDSLDYSTERLNLVKTIDQVSLNSWHEVTAHCFEMGETLMQNLQAYMQVCQSQLLGPDCQLDIFCFCPQRAAAITSRLERLYRAVKNAFFINQEIRKARYVLEIEERHYVIQYVDDQFRYYSYNSDVELYRALSQAQRTFCPIVFDELAQPNEILLAAILSFNKERVIQAFYSIVGDVYQMVVLDELGSMLRFVLPVRDELVFQSTVTECVQRMLESRQMTDSNDGNHLGLSFQLCKLMRQKDGQYKVKAMNNISNYEVQEVHVIGNAEGTKVNIDLSFHGVEFSYAEYGDRQYSALLHFAYQQQDFNERIPLKVTELMLNDSRSKPGYANLHQNRTLESFRLYARAEKELELARQKHVAS